MSTTIHITDPAAFRVTYGAQLATALIEGERMDPKHAAQVAAEVVALADFCGTGMTVRSPDGSESTVAAELNRIRIEIPFAFAKQVTTTTPNRDLTTAAGRRAAASDEAYRKATSDGNPFKKRYWNLTHQTMIAKKDPDLARRMKEAAGDK